MLRGGGPAQPPLRRMRAALGRARGAAPRAAPPSSAGAAPLREALPLVLAQAASTWQSAPARRPSSAAPPLAVSTTPPLGERARAPRPTAAAGHARLRQAQKSGSCRGRAQRRGRSRSTRAGARLARPTAPARAARRRVSARQGAGKPPMARWAEVRSETSSLGGRVTWYKKCHFRHVTVWRRCANARFFARPSEPTLWGVRRRGGGLWGPRRPDLTTRPQIGGGPE